MTLIALTVATLLGSLLSLIGGILLLHKNIKREKIMLYAMPFGAGALLGAAFFDVLPEVLHEVHDMGGTEQTILTWVLIGFVLFFIMERTIRWFHRHHEHGEERSHKTLIVLGDTIHNAIDGVAIGAAFLVSIPTGIVTTIAVAAHELPQEIGDFGMLLGKGMRARKVLFINIMSSLATVVTALLTFWIGASIGAIVPLLLAVVSGCFIYIAAADIIPDIHERPHRQANIQSAFLLIGIVIIPLFGLVIEALTGAHH